MRKFYFIVGGIVVTFLFGLIVYNTYIKPSGFETGNEITSSFITNIKENDVCDTHFTSESKASCIAFTDALLEDTVSIKNSTWQSSNLIVVLDINGNEGSFEFHFQVTKNSGLEGIFNSEYYLIEHIE